MNLHYVEPTIEGPSAISANEYLPQDAVQRTFGKD